MDIDNSFFHALLIKRLQPSSLLARDDRSFCLTAPTSALVGVLEGEAQIRGEDITLRKGDVIYIPPTYACSFLRAAADPLILAAIDVSFSYHGLDVSFALPKEPTPVNVKSSPSLLQDISIVSRISGGNLDVQQTAECMAAGYRIMGKLFEEMGATDNSILDQHKDPAVSNLLRYLESNYRLPLTVEDIAAECNVSRRQLFKITARIDDLTPIRLLKKIRLERSLELLHQEAIPVNQVAALVGFASSKSFSREFKRSFGMLPRVFRQQALAGSQVMELLKKADTNMRDGHPKRATVLYRRAIENAHEWTNLDELYFKMGHALSEMGNTSGAFGYWDRVTSLFYRLQVHLKNCERMSKHRDAEEIVALLRECYRFGDQAMQETVVEKLSDWMFQSATAERIVAAKEYCEFAKELVMDHPTLEQKLARCLFITGQFKDIETYCPRVDFYVAAGLRAAGLYDEHLERFPQLREQCASIYYRRGNYAKVLTDYSDQPKQCVASLVALGRPEEGLAKFPETGFLSHVALEQYRQILDEYPDDKEFCSWALAFLGYKEEALTMAAGNLDILNNLELFYEMPHNILSKSTSNDTYRNAANLLHAIHLLERGLCDQTLEIIDSIVPMTSETYRFGHGFYHTDLFIPCIRHLFPDLNATSKSLWRPWRGHFNMIVTNYKHYYAQQHWHAVRFILDDIDEESYLGQPNAVAAEHELDLIKGMKADFLNQPQDALIYYRAFMDHASAMENVVLWGEWFLPVKLAFARWRIKELPST